MSVLQAQFLGIAALVVFSLARQAGRKLSHKEYAVAYVLPSGFFAAGRGQYPFLAYLLGIYTEMSFDLAFNSNYAARPEKR